MKFPLFTFFCLTLSLGISQGARGQCTTAPPTLPWYFTSPGYVVTVTWNNDPAAWGTLATLTDGQFGGYTEEYAVPAPNNSITFYPNNFGNYTLSLSSMCGATSVSSASVTLNVIIDKVPAVIIVSDLIIKHNGGSCTRESTVWTYGTLPANQSIFTNAELLEGVRYNYEFSFWNNCGSQAGGTTTVQGFFQNMGLSGNGLYKSIKTYNHPFSPWNVAGINQYSSNGLYHIACIRQGDAGTPSVNVSYNYFNGTRPYLIASNMTGTQCIKSFTIYRCAGSGGGKPGEPEVTSVDAAEASGVNSSVLPNPFSNELSVKFETLPKANAQINLYNASGVLQNTYMARAADLRDQTYDIPTTGLEQGLYFLSVQFDSGEKQVFKVVKVQ